MGALSGKMGAVYKSYTGTDKSKEIANFQSGETWVDAFSATSSSDTDNVRLGTQSIKVIDDNDTGTEVIITQESLTLDLAEFADNATASDTGDYIYLVFFISGISYVNAVKVEFSSASTFDFNNRFRYTINTIVEGWNYVKIKKSAFTINGTVDWATLQSAKVAWDSAAGANAAGAYVSFQSLYLLDDSKTYDFALINNTAYTLECMTLIYNWTVDAQTDVADVTSFLCDGVQFKEFIPLLNMFTVSSEAFWGNGDFLDNLTSNFILSLYIDTVNGYRYDGLGKLTSDNISNDVADVVNETIEFQGDNDLKYVDVQIIDS
jgi:hypothetical protein